MPAIAASAPGKIILFGEHAVVYGRPAIAAPVLQASARAAVSANPAAPSGTVRIIARDLQLDSPLAALPVNHPLAAAVRETMRRMEIDALPACTLHVSSTIPPAAGLGSGTAVSAAIARAVSAFAGRPLTDEGVSEVAFRVDHLHHGTPSGVDNTVISYAQPIWFVRQQPFQLLRVAQPFTIVIGNTGVRSPTGAVVQDLRQRAAADPAAYENYFNIIAGITTQARACIEQGETGELGALLSQNHAVLQRLDVSLPLLDALVEAALRAGALGAKMSGGGRGGNMLALCAPQQAEAVTSALTAAGAVKTLTTTIQ